MDIKITPGALSGKVSAIPSKSQAHRALICAALADIPTHIKCEGTSRDIEATAACLTALGADIRSEASGCAVRPRGSDNRDLPLHCGESGSTFRFLLPVAGALGRKTEFRLEGRLSERPLSPLYEELVRFGCTLSPRGSNPFFIEGQLMPGSFSLEASVSSQFISGLLFALPLLGADSEIHMTGRIESLPYIELTVLMLEKFGIKTILNDNVFSVPGGQLYRSPRHVAVEGDWSNAAFWLAAGALDGEGITCTGLDIQSRQGDRAIVELLTRFGATVIQGSSAVTVSGGGSSAGSGVGSTGGQLKGIDIDARDIPDLVPILSVVATAAEGTTRIYNAGRLRGKESDRLATVTDMLGKLGADVSESEDGLIINGGGMLKGGVVSSWGDHRIVMSAAIAAILCTEPVVITGAEAVNKSYPGFFAVRKKLV